jgi:hypothetical protein
MVREGDPKKPPIIRAQRNPFRSRTSAGGLRRKESRAWSQFGLHDAERHAGRRPILASGHNCIAEPRNQVDGAEKKLR